MQLFFDNMSTSISLQAISPNRKTFFVFLCIIVIGLFSELITSLFFYCERAIDRKATEVFRCKLHEKLAVIEALSYEDNTFLDNLNKADIGIKAAVTTVIRITVLVACNLTYLVVIYIILFSIHPILPLMIVLAFIPVIFNQYFLLSLYSNLEDSIAPLRRECEAYEKCICNKEFFKETRQLNASDYFIKKFKSSHSNLNKQIWQNQKKSARINLISDFATSCGYILILLFLFHLLVNQEITIGSFAAIFSSVGIMFFVLRNMISQQVADVSKNFGSVYNYYDFINQPVRQGNIDMATGNDIHIQNISFRYPQSKHNAISNVTLDIPYGETIAIVGENGSGKTTLSHLIMGLYLPTSGAILYGNTPTDCLQSKIIFSKWSAVFQKFQQYPLSLANNVQISYFLKETEKNKEEQINSIIKALENADLFIDMFQEKLDLDTVLCPEFGGCDLSGGQWQRVAIARALYRPHDMIIMDEPTSAIDPVEESLLYRMFAEMSESKTSLLITHRIGAARFADHIIVMEKGKIVETGNYQELLNKRGLFYKMHQSQAKWYTSEQIPFHDDN